MADVMKISWNRNVSRLEVETALRKEDRLDDTTPYFVVARPYDDDGFTDFCCETFSARSAYEHLPFKNTWILTDDLAIAYFVDEDDAVIFKLAAS